MSDTVIQIKRSTNTAIPTSLQQGEMAFTSNGDTLWIGSPSGSNTANVVHIGSKISYFGNSTQLGSTASGSNSELVSSFAIKSYVDGRFDSYSTTLSGLDDVDISTPADNNLLVYDSIAGKWENHTIAGTSSEIAVNFTNNNITVRLANDVVIPNSLTVTQNLVVTGTANVTGEAHFENVVHIDRDESHSSHYITEPTLIATANVNNWTQVSVQNFNTGANASADFIAYPDNTQLDDATGFIDVGITGSNYNQAAYSVTGPNDGYVFASARANSALGGSLVLATDSTGTKNDIKFFVGGFTYNTNTPHAILVGAGAGLGNFGINNATPTSKLSVGGDGWFSGNVVVNSSLNANVSVNVGADITVNNTVVKVGNSTVNTTVGFSGVTVSGGGSLSVSNATSSFTVNNGIAVLTDSITVGNSSVNAAITPSSIAVTGTLSAGNTTLGDANIASAYIVGTLAAGNTTITGDLTVTGTVTTVDTVNLVIEDSLIRLAKNQANTETYTDAVDIGFYGIYGNTSSPLAAGFARESGSNNFVIFVGKDPAGIDNDGITTSDSLGILYTYLASGGLTTTPTTVTLTANSTVNVSIAANSLTLSTALAVGSGGTGKNTFTSNQILLGNGTSAIGEITNGANGQVLQIINNIPAFAGLDGGTF